jgi:adenosylhomocysteine nucleosidase
MRPTLLLVTALSWEARQIVRYIEGLQSVRQGERALWGGRHGGFDVWVLKTGIGQERAAQGLRWAQHIVVPDVVLSTGCAGGLASGLVAGDVIIAEDVVTADGNSRPLSIPWRERYGRASDAAGLRSRRGTILSNAAIVTATDDKRRLAGGAGALAVEMEAAAIAGWATETGVPFAAARVILDCAEMPIAADVAALTTGAGSVSPRRLLAALARRPAIVRDLLAVASAARTCRRALADLHRELLHGL